ncbi:DUF6712 family protein [Moorena sp. SIO3H5]|uniref:DUF6712 family protein n=1 Tax=Moorena sp. SIO3H5 TaxID=2607834 RepID=UPI0013BB7239|nr:DUF6712 family protein [Moorena sp. SIO3H5]NEO72146.1 hypothetical protein [Moorena sp. SIO3H5]
MATVSLVDITDFRERVILSQNLNSDRIKIASNLVQEKQLQRILCTQLYDEILSEYPDNLSPANEALMPFIKDFLVFRSYYEYVATGNIQSTPAGFRIANPTDSVAASSEDLQSLGGKALSDANYYQDQLINFLVKNEDNYPLWKNSSCNCPADLRPYLRNKFSGIGSPFGYTPIQDT